MMNIFKFSLVFFPFILISNTASAVDPFGTLDLRNRTERTEHIISICARNSPNKINFPTHMFVTFSKFSNSGALEFLEAVGWMPQNNKKISVSEVPGYFKPELMTHASQQCFNVKVNGEIWEGAYKLGYRKIENFNISRLSQGNKFYLSYFLLQKDCITFAQDVAKKIGLAVPNRGSQIPIKYVETLYRENRAQTQN